MKILFICSGNASQGISPIISRQAQSLKEKNMEVDVFPVNGKGFSGYYKAIFELKTFLKTNHYHVLHAHYGLCAYVALFGGGKTKKIISFMGDDILGEHDIYGKRKTLSLIIAFLNKITAACCFNAILVKSQEMKSKFKPSNKLYSIPNGVNTNVFFSENMQEARQTLQIDPNSKLVLFVANPKRPEKNYKLAEEAMKTLPPDYALKVVQNADEKDLRLYYNAADVVLMTSFHEGSPNVIKEAMACNCPIVSTPVGDVKEVIGETEGCYLTHFHTQSVAESIQKAVLFRKEYGYTTGRNTIMSLGLDAEQTADKIIQVYQSILN